MGKVTSYDNIFNKIYGLLGDLEGEIGVLEDQIEDDEYHANDEDDEEEDN